MVKESKIGGEPHLVPLNNLFGFVKSYVGGLREVVRTVFPKKRPEIIELPKNTRAPRPPGLGDWR